MSDVLVASGLSVVGERRWSLPPQRRLISSRSSASLDASYWTAHSQSQLLRRLTRPVSISKQSKFNLSQRLLENYLHLRRLGN